MHHIILHPWRSTSQVFFSCQELINLLFPGRGYSLKCKGMAKIMKEFIRIFNFCGFRCWVISIYLCYHCVKHYQLHGHCFDRLLCHKFTYTLSFILSFRQNAQEYSWNLHKCHFMQIWFRTYFLLAELWWTFRPMGLMHFL